MKRLRPFGTVEVCTASPFDAQVVAVDRRQVALHPVKAVDIVWLPKESPDVLLLFRHAQQRVILKGTLYHRGDLDLVGFVASDPWCVPAPATRAPRCAPVGMVALGPDRRPVGEEVWHQTRALGADGARLEPGCPLPAGTIVRVEIALPTDFVHVELTGVLEPGTDEELELRFVEISADERVRLHRYVVAEQLADIKRRTAAQEESYVW